MKKKNLRQFETGATRDTEDNKLDFEGFFAPSVLFVYAEYMNKNRTLPDGSKRASDNWQMGIPMQVYLKSLVRHLMQLWGIKRGVKVKDDKGVLVNDIDSLCGVLFNAHGLLFEILKEKNGDRVQQ